MDFPGASNPYLLGPHRVHLQLVFEPSLQEAQKPKNLVNVILVVNPGWVWGVRSKVRVFVDDTVDGRNPAPPNTHEALYIMVIFTSTGAGFLLSKVCS